MCSKNCPDRVAVRDEIIISLLAKNMWKRIASMTGGFLLAWKGGGVTFIIQ